MKVYLVVEDDYESCRTIAVFSQKEYAEKHIALHNTCCWEVVEMEVDKYNYKDIEVVKKLHYKILVYKLREEILTLGNGVFDNYSYVKTEVPEDRTIIYSEAKEVGDFLAIGWIEVWADSVAEGKEKVEKRVKEIKERFQSQLNKGI
jgi:hypothetical protein